MKKAAIWIGIIAFVVLLITWGVVGLKLLDGDYDVTVGAHIALVAMIVLFACILFVKFSNRCAHCGKLLPVQGKYCPYCGKEIG